MNCIGRKQNLLFSKWIKEKLPMKAVLKPRPPKMGLKAMDLISFYTTLIIFATGASLGTFSFFGELISKRKI